MSAVVDVLIHARALIEKPEAWTKGADARSKTGRKVMPNSERAVCFCALGAVEVASISDGGIAGSRARSVLRSHLPTPQFVYQFNDDPATTHADVLAAFDRAIAAEQVVS